MNDNDGLLSDESEPSVIDNLQLDYDSESEWFDANCSEIEECLSYSSNWEHLPTFPLLPALIFILFNPFINHIY